MCVCVCVSLIFEEEAAGRERERERGAPRCVSHTGESEKFVSSFSITHSLTPNEFFFF